MARPTRSRRSTKHRGNAAGMIEARGRTGRKPTATEKRTASSSTARAGARSTGRGKRYDKPPTWKGSVVRALIAAAIVYGILTLFTKNTNAARNLVLMPVVLAVYTPLIFYTDRYMYRRAQRKRAGR